MTLENLKKYYNYLLKEINIILKEKTITIYQEDDLILLKDQIKEHIVLLNSNDNQHPGFWDKYFASKFCDKINDIYDYNILKYDNWLKSEHANLII